MKKLCELILDVDGSGLGWTFGSTAEYIQYDDVVRFGVLILVCINTILTDLHSTHDVVCASASASSRAFLRGVSGWDDSAVMERDRLTPEDIVAVGVLPFSSTCI